MRVFRFSFWLLLVAACFVFAPGVRAQIGVSNLVDKSSSYNDRVTFFITNAPGNTYLALLNGQPIAVGTAVTIDKPDFYELFMWRTNTGTLVVDTQYVRFIVQASDRVGTEAGLPRQTPWPVIQSSPSEFAGTHLRVMTPRNFPTNYGVPVVAWVLGDDDHAVRGNGLLSAPGHASIQLKRGVGSGFLASNLPPGTLNYAAQLGGIATIKTIDIEASTTWTTVSGTLSGNIVWPTNSRIHVTGPTIILAGSSLTVSEGTVVRVNGGVEITNQGTITINGTFDNPVVFMAATETPWGGFVQHANNTSFTATGAIFTGSGLEPCWYSNSERGCNTGLSGQGSHRTEQPLISMNGANCSIVMTDCAAISLAGQFSHSAGSGPYTIRLTRFLLQRATSGGQYDNATMIVNDSALIEIPSDSVVFEDEDHDALYLASGAYAFTNMLIGWTKDDGIDSGGGGYGPLTYQSCWFEATFHEGNSLSGYKNVLARDTVYYGVGQGIEDGYDSPTGRVDHCLFTANQTGVRWGDNYTGGYVYNGYMLATNCISIYNHRDLFGFNFAANGWTNSDHLSAGSNWITTPTRFYPNNSLWNPANDGWRLGAFGGVGRVGVGFGNRGTSLSGFPDGIPVGLSRFCTNQVAVDYALDGTDGTHITGTLVFPAGLTRNYIPAPTNVNGVLRVGLANAVNADVTGASSLLFQNLPPETNAPPVVLSPLASQWKYLDDATDQGTAWRAPSFNDSTWSNGVGRLGVGSDPAPLGTPVRRFVPGSTTVQVTNFYFRRAIVVSNATNFANMQMRYQRDDGCIVYLNGVQMFTNNMGQPPYTANSFAASTISGAPALLTFWTNTIAATNFISGTNVIAVEVHQSTATSSDIAWEMELLGIPATRPRIGLTRLGTDTAIFWGDGSSRLEQADFVIGPWTTVSNVPSPFAVPPGTSQKFYRLSR